MTVLYNHRAVEQKWRENWKKHPVNVNDGKKPKDHRLKMFPVSLRERTACRTLERVCDL